MLIKSKNRDKQRIFVAVDLNNHYNTRWYSTGDDLIKPNLIPL
jgi:hypothetical protein